MLSSYDLTKIKIRLTNIGNKITKHISFNPSEVGTEIKEENLSSTITCLENFGSMYELDPKNVDLLDDWNIFAYDESAKNYGALEGNLLFCSSSVIMVEKTYRFKLTVLPYFITFMEKYKGLTEEGIRFTKNVSDERNLIFTELKTSSLLESVAPGSIILIDGPLIGGNISSYMVEMDKKLREKNCIPLYFVKNSESRLIVETNPKLAREFNSDFHWAACGLKTNSRTPFFKYSDAYNEKFTKVFTYMKPMSGFTERIEMHADTFKKYYEIMGSLMDLMAYFYILQGNPANPQVRPIVIAEKYAREGLKLINIPNLMKNLGFYPTINEIRFG